MTHVPVDPDSESLGPRRPVHFHPKLVALVIAGGTLGTLLRELVGLWAGTAPPFPAGTFAVNILGACALGFLLEALARRGPDRGRRQAIRLTLGTGLLGGFTTYSALATENAELVLAGDIGGFAVYAVATLLGGAAASGVGLWLGTRVPSRAVQDNGAASTSADTSPGSLLDEGGDSQ